MNIQDIADFIDLVKNPEKAERVLQNIREEEDRLNAVIETVAKASELDKLRKEVEKERDTLKADFEKSLKEQEARVEKEVLLLAKKKASMDEATSKANELIAVTENKLAEAEALIIANKQKESDLARELIIVTEKQTQLDASLTEYEERVTKLRSVMV